MNSMPHTISQHFTRSTSQNSKTSADIAAGLCFCSSTLSSAGSAHTHTRPYSPSAFYLLSPFYKQRLPLKSLLQLMDVVYVPKTESSSCYLLINHNLTTPILKIRLMCSLVRKQLGIVKLQEDNHYNQVDMDVVSGRYAQKLRIYHYYNKTNP